MSEHKELVLKEDDKIIEYIDKPIIKENQISKRKINSTTHKEINKVALYKKLMNRNEFKRPESKEIVLDEDEYLNCLESLIQKQYYPDLYRYNQELQINKKLEESGSVTGNRSSLEIKELDKINSDYLNERKIQSKDIKLDNMNIDSFLMKYSSDELESLKDVIHKDKMKKLSKYFWMYETEYRANEKLKALKEYETEYLALPQHKNKHYENPNIITAQADAKNSFFFNPDFSNTNQKIENSGKTIQIGFSEESNKFSSNIVQLKEKSVISANTRMPDEFLSKIYEKDSSQFKKKLYEAYESSDVVKLLKELKELDQENEKDKVEKMITPMVKGYKLIKDPKLITDTSIPIFTWGEVASTPNLINQKSDKNFYVPQTPIREDLAHSLHSKNQLNKNLTKKLQKVGSKDRIYELTPSAMKLLDSVKRKSTNIFDDPNQVRTPSINTRKTDKLNKSVLSIKSIKK